MKNQQVKALLAVTVSATLLSGCGFNPHDEEVALLYAPVQVEELEEFNQNKDTEPTDNFDPSSEVEMDLYGPAVVD